MHLRRSQRQTNKVLALSSSLYPLLLFDAAHAHCVQRSARLHRKRTPLHHTPPAASPAVFGSRPKGFTPHMAPRMPFTRQVTERLVMAVDPLKTAAPPLASSVRKKICLRRRQLPARALSTEGDGPLLRVRAHEARGRAADWGGARLPWRNARPAAACPQGAARAAMLPRAGADGSFDLYDLDHLGRRVHARKRRRGGASPHASCVRGIRPSLSGGCRWLLYDGRAEATEVERRERRRLRVARRLEVAQPRDMTVRRLTADACCAFSSAFKAGPRAGIRRRSGRWRRLAYFVNCAVARLVGRDDEWCQR